MKNLLTLLFVICLTSISIQAQTVLLPDQCQCDTAFVLGDSVVVVGTDTLELQGLIDSLETLTVLGLAADDLLFYIDENRDTNFVALNDSIFMDHDFYEVGTSRPPDDINDQIYTLNRLGVGIEFPAGILHVNSEDSRDALFSQFNDDASNDMDIDLIRGFGTTAVPLPIYQDSVRLGGLRYRTYVNPPAALSSPLDAFAPSAEIAAETDGTPTLTSAPGRLLLATTPAGALRPINRLVIRQDGKIGMNVPNPSNLLHIRDTDDPLRIEGLQERNTDSVLCIDGQGVVSFRPSTSLRPLTVGSEDSPTRFLSNKNLFSGSMRVEGGLYLPLRDDEGVLNREAFVVQDHEPTPMAAGMVVSDGEQAQDGTDQIGDDSARMPVVQYLDVERTLTYLYKELREASSRTEEQQAGLEARDVRIDALTSQIERQQAMIQTLLERIERLEQE